MKIKITNKNGPTFFEQNPGQSRWWGVIVLACALGGACNDTADSWQPAAGDAADGGSGSLPAFADATVPLPVGDGSGATQMCDESNFEISQEPIEVLIVLDRSNSMKQMDYWISIIDALKALTTQLSPQINFGLMVFPSLSCDPSSPSYINNNLCSVATSPGLPLSGPTASDAISQHLDDLKRIGTCGGTPTARTLQGALGYLRGRTSPYKRYVLLATDGAPNCNPVLNGATCTCTANISFDCHPENCLDEDATISAARALAAAGIPVFVFGMGQLSQWNAVMNQIAAAGGTERYYPAEQPDKFLPVLQNALGAAVSCDFHLEWEKLKQSASRDPGRVNIYCKDQADQPINPQGIIRRDPACAQGQGWDWQDDNTLSFCAKACEDLKQGRCKLVTATFGCNTMLIE